MVKKSIFFIFLFLFSCASNTDKSFDMLEDAFSNWYTNNHYHNINFLNSSKPYNIHLFNKNQLRTLLHTHNSAPLYMLLSLSNSESHNFTSEVLLRSASSKWEADKSSKDLKHWLGRKGISIKNLHRRLIPP